MTESRAIYDLCMSPCGIATFGAPGIATNGAIGRYERGWPYYALLLVTRASLLVTSCFVNRPNDPTIPLTGADAFPQVDRDGLGLVEWPVSLGRCGDWGLTSNTLGQLSKLDRTENTGKHNVKSMLSYFLGI